MIRKKGIEIAAVVLIVLALAGLCGCYLWMENSGTSSTGKTMGYESALFGTDYAIKSLSLKGVKYSDQILPNGDNKIAFLPLAFESTKFGHKSIAVSPGPVVIKDYKIDYITPTTFAQKKYDILEYSKDEVEDFLKSFDYAHVKIK